MNKKLSILTVCTFGVFGSTSAQHQPQLGKSPINEIISAMTIDEKVALLVGFGDEDTPDSIPSATIGFTKKIIPGAAGITHAIPRLGIPSVVLADGPAGLRIDPKRPGTDSTFYCTHFPVATSLASTWNTPLVKSVGNAIGNETLEYGVDILLAPATNIMRNPLCGRNFEYYSEDPILAGKLTSAMIQGIQQNGVGTSIKHFALNNQETNRTGNNVLVSPYVMHELYLKPFEIAIRESTPWTVMSSYNKVNGEYASENSLLLDSILRRRWGYKGLVMTDWFGGQDAVKQTVAGNDLLMPGLKKQRKALKDAVENGKLSTHILDRNVQRILELIIKTPRFQQYDYTNTVDLGANARISRMAAAEGMVLLKNDNLTLPLDKSQTGRIALFGISSYDFIPGGTGSGDVNRAYTISLAEGLKQAGFQWDEKLAELYDTYIKKETDALPERQFDDPVQRIAEMELSDTLIQAQASYQDMAVVTIGRISGEFHDRNLTDDFLLSQTEQKLIENVCTAFHQKGKKVTVILNTCGVLETSSWKEQPDAILVSWLAGQEGGNAVADILTGTVT
ncbi:glycoside hydrolase family 3 protein, partial [Bacteroides salyersiae]